MKITKFVILSLILILSQSCGEKGNTSLVLDEREYNLPPELEGLKLYWVSTSSAGTGVYVAVMDDNVISTTHTSGKSNQSTILLNRNQNQIIEIGGVVMENDSLIICRKK